MKKHGSAGKTHVSKTTNLLEPKQCMNSQVSDSSSELKISY